MKTIRIGFAAFALAVVAFSGTGCKTQGEKISEPSGSAVYRDGQWQPVDSTKFREVRDQNGQGYTDGRGVWHRTH